MNMLTKYKILPPTVYTFEYTNLWSPLIISLIYNERKQNDTIDYYIYQKIEMPFSHISLYPKRM